MNDDSSISDATLIQQFVAGDESAMNCLVERYRRPLFSWLKGQFSNQETAEDVYQDIWIRIIKYAPRFNDVSFRAWMWQIARNRVIDVRRRMRPTVSLDAVADDDETPMVDTLADTRHSPADSIATKDMMRRVNAELAKLPDTQREIFIMRTQGNMSFNVIAETLGIPLNTALGRMHDAMTKLRNALAKAR